MHSVLTVETRVTGTHQETEDAYEIDVREDAVRPIKVTNATGCLAGAKLICLDINAQSLLSKPDVFTVYRPSRIDQVADTHLLEQLEKFSSQPNVIIMRDLNAPEINWSTVKSACLKLILITAV
uniref:Endo/exonuclease/phosphatase domain-containing protein n=1 Tax=Schistocephalus solidus TaxID=70667 RepID=A0A0X3PJ98_SCHSO